MTCTTDIACRVAVRSERLGMALTPCAVGATGGRSWSPNVGMVGVYPEGRGVHGEVCIVP